MKKVFFLFILLPAFSFSQEIEKKPGKNEIGLNLFSITQFEKNRGMLDKPHITARFNPLSGLYYKRHYGKNAFRASFDYSTHSRVEGDKNNPIGDPFYMPYFYAANIQTVSIAAGYERSFGNGKLRPYVFGDVVFNYETACKLFHGEVSD